MKDSIKQLIQQSAKAEIVNQFKYGVIDHPDWNAFTMFGESGDNATIAYEANRPDTHQKEWNSLTEDERWDAEDARDQFVERAKKQIEEADESKLKEIAEMICPTHIRNFLINEGVINHTPVL